MKPTVMPTAMLNGHHLDKEIRRLAAEQRHHKSSPMEAESFASEVIPEFARQEHRQNCTLVSCRLQPKSDIDRGDRGSGLKQAVGGRGYAAIIEEFAADDYRAFGEPKWNVIDSARRKALRAQD